MQDDLTKRIEELRESVRAREAMIDAGKLSGELVSEVQLRILARHRGDLALLEELQRARPVVRAAMAVVDEVAAGRTSQAYQVMDELTKAVEELRGPEGD